MMMECLQQHGRATTKAVQVRWKETSTARAVQPAALLLLRRRHIYIQPFVQPWTPVTATPSVAHPQWLVAILAPTSAV